MLIRMTLILLTSTVVLGLVACKPPSVQVYKQSLRQQPHDRDLRELPLEVLRDYYSYEFNQLGGFEISLNNLGRGHVMRVISSEGSVFEEFHINGLFVYQDPVRSTKEPRLFLEFKLFPSLTAKSRYALTEVTIKGNTVLIKPVAFDMNKIVEEETIEFSRGKQEGSWFEKRMTVTEINFGSIGVRAMLEFQKHGSTYNGATTYKAGKPGYDNLIKIRETLQNEGLKLEPLTLNNRTRCSQALE